MKRTLKIATLILALAGFTYTAKAQTATTTTKSGVRYSIGVETGIPVGNFNDVSKWNLGGSVQADIPVANQVFVTVNAGYNNFFGETVGNIEYNNVQLLPVKAGVKYFPVQNFYIQGEAGAAFLLNKADTFNDKSAAFLWAPQIGVQFPVSASGNFIDAGIRYESTSNYISNIDSKVQFVGLRLAYGF
ncbi:outer membrane beta-barrel protein [Mucilaginibacter litoreus]|uniref:Outer membrane beta-barrel protein n=1 Tax=Mucilaginibacter litoreus TaxID=1048221 RepID=A0ABW3AX28_9SPHI